MKITVKMARIKADYTMFGMSEAFGVSRPTYAKLEEKPQLITKAQRQILCQLSGVDEKNIEWGK